MGTFQEVATEIINVATNEPTRFVSQPCVAKKNSWSRVPHETITKKSLSWTEHMDQITSINKALT